MFGWFFGRKDENKVATELRAIDGEIRRVQDSDVSGHRMSEMLGLLRDRLNRVAATDVNDVGLKERVQENLGYADALASQLSLLLPNVQADLDRDRILAEVTNELDMIENQQVATPAQIREYKNKLAGFKRRLDPKRSNRDKALLAQIGELDSLLDTLAATSEVADNGVPGECRTVLAQGNQYAAARAAGIAGNLNATCASQAAMAIDFLTPKLQQGQEVTSADLDECMRQGALRHLATITRLRKQAQDNLTIENVRVGAQFPGLDFGEELDPETPTTAEEMRQYYSIYILGTLMSRKQTEPDRVSSLVLIKGPEASSLFMAGERFYHFDSHGTDRSQNKAYLQCFASPNDMLNYLMQRYPFMANVQPEYHSFEIREVWKRM